MKKLLVYLSFSALLLTTGTPALAQTPQEDQYGGPEVISCDEYLSYEVPPPDIIERCSTQYNRPTVYPTDPFPDARDVIPEANKSSNQTFDSFSNILSEIRSGGRNKAEAGTGSPTSKDTEAKRKAENEQFGLGSESKNNDSNSAVSKNKAGTEDKADPRDGSRNTAADAPDATALSEITELPQTAGVPFVLVGAGALLLAGGLAASRLFR